MEVDTERQQKAKEYARLRHRLLLVDLSIAAAGVLIVLLSGLGIWLRNILHPLAWQPIPGWSPWRVLVYFLILMVSYMVITAPLTYYSGFVKGTYYCWIIWSLAIVFRNKPVFECFNSKATRAAGKARSRTYAEQDGGTGQSFDQTH